MRYRSFADEIRLHKVHIPDSGAHITFVMPMPQSWSEKKKAQMDGQPHQTRPDLDNMIKAAADAVHKEDSHIWQISACKVWGREGQIVIEYDQGEVAA